ncbi:4Fe-4S single cluster domain-containing protein [Actinomyces slackii]|uniref:4Fe-4S single cluster domain-containing protein n=1 Tax=Actinomyces slackii TaxID=52774 RepID=UPI00055090B1|nr:4Fe-4S single cluster domain-containing protein [Actinomyces slackii]
MGEGATIALARLIEQTAAEGPGWRTAIWVQGCSIRCAGCFNPDLWGHHGGTPTQVSDILDRLPSSIEGITLLGGEPFEQAEPLAALAKEVRDRDMSVMTFTGFLREDLEASNDASVRALLSHTDLLVDGPFDAQRLDTVRPWVGSTNQRFHALTPRYVDLVAQLPAIPDRLEIHVSPTGTLEINGWASPAVLEALLSDL